MKVKYIGPVDQISCDYNGKRYVFNKKEPIRDIPIEVFRLVTKESSGVISEYFEPYEAPKEQVIETNMDEKIDTYLKNKEEVKKPGRPKKGVVNVR